MKKYIKYLKASPDTKRLKKKATTVRRWLEPYRLTLLNFKEVPYIIYSTDMTEMIL